MPDYTFKDPEGNTWASEHEWRVYDALGRLGAPVRRSVPGTGDTFRYSERVARVSCLDCGSNSCVQERTYTPDLRVSESQALLALEGQAAGGYWIEAKGYFRADKRALFRHFRKGYPDLDIRLVVQRAHRVGKGSILTWASRYAKVHAWVWDWKRDDITDVVPPEWIIW